MRRTVARQSLPRHPPRLWLRRSRIDLSVVEEARQRRLETTGSPCGQGLPGRRDCRWSLVEWSHGGSQHAAAIEVEDLDAAGVLARLADAERLRPDGAAEKLRLAYQWCVQHPATAETGTATWGDAGLPGLADCDASLGGDGTPGVAAFVAEELGAAMGVSTQSAMALMADALDLRHRLPRLWALVEVAGGGAVEDPPGRRRHPLPARSRRPGGWTSSSPPGSTGSGCRPSSGWSPSPRPGTHPRSRPRRSRRHRARHHVTLTHPRPGEFAGTSWLEAAGDTQDLTAFYDLVCEEAKRLGRLGDTDDYETRKAKALGIIAARQGAPRPHRRGTRTPTGDLAEPVQTTLYLHVSLADLATHLAPAPRSSVRSRGSAPPPST